MLSFSIHESSCLALRVYADGLTLSGPRKNHSTFWPTLQKRVQLEDPAELSKVLGRNHVICDQGLALHPADFAKAVCRTLRTIVRQEGQAFPHSSL